MRVLIINEVLGVTSTGKICAQIADEYSRQGNEVKVAYGRLEYVPDEYKKYAIQIGHKGNVILHAIMTRLLDWHGFGSRLVTEKFINWAENYKPDVVWMHNLHGYYINVEVLFAWLKKHPEIEKKWTLHDCWSFTGHCTHYSYARCEKWKTACDGCIQIKEYPKAFRDNSRNNYNRKKSAFCGVNNLKIVVPSKWLGDQVGQSFLNEYLIEIHNNKIDVNVFYPRKSEFKIKHKIEGKMILGVANVWNAKKGLDDFVKLANLLKGKATVVLVGLNSKQIKGMENIVVGIGHTKSQKELAEIYSAADVFVNLTYEDTYPTVNLEAQACGTPCITYNTGGSVESVPRENIVEQGDLKTIVNKVMSIKEKYEYNF